ncbi:MAG: DUF2185 domain-containing protein [Myxococcaceae bacterium]|nr:DUF2185 domain-containing protein [Myxococcaceae bacterium]MCI0669408.1 DUF2185 domain-containing protein [Myxococcaceae bacterium]
MPSPLDAELPRELLGTVTAPSGVVLMMDGGVLGLWSHDRLPVLPPGCAAPEAVALANAALDLRIDGPDAERAGRVFDRQWHSRYLFDVPRGGLRHLEERFAECVRRHGLNAQLVPLVRRVAHRDRVTLALEHGSGAGVVQFHGLWAVAVGGLPPNETLSLLGSRLPEDVEARRWRTVALECRPGVQVVRSEQVGFVVVDEARLMVADADALGAWRQDESLDGLADVVLWGPDAAEASRRLGASPVDSPGEQSLFGWTDLPVRACAELGLLAEQLRELGLSFTTDVRPHSHAFHVLRQARVTPTGSGQLEVGGARMCQFLTTWGDGGFPVFRDLDARGALVRIRVELGNAHVARLRGEQERNAAELSRLAFVSGRVLAPGGRVGFLYRDPPDGPDQSGWCLLSGEEDAAAHHSPEALHQVPLRELVALDPTLEPVLRTPPGCAFVRLEPGGPFVPVGDVSADGR